LPSNAQVHRKNVPHDTFSFEQLSAAEPLAFDRSLSVRWLMVMFLGKVLGDSVLQVGTQEVFAAC